MKDLKPSEPLWDIQVLSVQEQAFVDKLDDDQVAMFNHFVLNGWYIMEEDDSILLP